MEFDVVIVGGGPAGLSAAIRLKQLSPDCAVCLVEKAGELGAHTLAGATLEPRALNELIPDWKEKGAPLHTESGEDRFLWLTEVNSTRLPTPPQMHNHGNYIISLVDFVRWLGAQAEELGVEIYPGFAASEILEEEGRVVGIATGDMGVGKDGKPTGNFQRGMELRAKYTLFAEGCRGSLTGRLMERYHLRDGHDPQTYGIGIKELWEIPAEHHKPGLCLHALGWPLKSDTYGGATIYHFGANLVSYYFVVGLDYKNPYLSPFEEMQRFKTHPDIRGNFEGGRRIAYGARALNEGGIQAMPTLIFPGGALIGDCASFMNVSKFKGAHTSMKSGMVAAEAAIEALAHGSPPELTAYPENLRQSWAWEELELSRNLRPAFAKWGRWGGMAYAAIDTYIFRGKAPWTLHNKHPDHESLMETSMVRPIEYPKPDGKLTFDRLSSVFISNTNHEENQPVHLRLRDPAKAIAVNYKKYASPETRYCPAGVYEIEEIGGKPSLRINAQNCVHCKTCDIKDPEQNINWVTPEGGGGPVYPGGM